jgi:hypothetical protein
LRIAREFNPQSEIRNPQLKLPIFNRGLAL